MDFSDKAWSTDCMDVDQLTQQFVDEVHSQPGIDDDGEMCWLSLVYGWALGKGYAPADAMNFSLHIRYHTDFG
jgi:hypothetical protein